MAFSWAGEIEWERRTRILGRRAESQETPAELEEARWVEYEVESYEPCGRE